MKFEGSREVKTSAGAVWDFMNNPNNMAQCLPDVKSHEIVDDKTIKAQMKVGVGFIKEVFDSTLHFSDVKEDTRDMKITIDAKAKSNTATINIDVHVGEDGSNAKLNWTVDAVMAGRLASIGQRYISKVSDRVIEQAFECMMSKLAPS